MTILKFYEWVRCNLTSRHNLTSWLWLVGGKPEYTSREVYSLHARFTHSEVELRKCCLGQSEKKQNSLSFNKIQYVITIVGDLRQVVGGFLRVLQFPSRPIIPRGHHPPSSQCFRHWHGLLDVFFYWNKQFLNNVIIIKTKVLLPEA